MAVDGATGEAECAVEQVPVVETVTRDADGVVLERSTVAVSTRQAEERVEKIMLAVGNTTGVAQVESKVEVANAAPESKTYEVKKGDTLWKISE